MATEPVERIREPARRRSADPRSRRKVRYDDRGCVRPPFEVPVPTTGGEGISPARDHCPGEAGQLQGLAADDDVDLPGAAPGRTAVAPSTKAKE